MHAHVYVCFLNVVLHTYNKVIVTYIYVLITLKYFLKQLCFHFHFRSKQEDNQFQILVLKTCLGRTTFLN